MTVHRRALLLASLVASLLAGRSERSTAQRVALPTSRTDALLDAGRWTEAEDVLYADVRSRPRDPEARGCQLSILAHENPKELHKKLEAAGVKADFREPNVIRAAPAPLYNSFHDVWRFAKILAEHQ